MPRATDWSGRLSVDLKQGSSVVKRPIKRFICGWVGGSINRHLKCRYEAVFA